MHPDIEELRPKLKEILYDCAVEIRATKAALYLYDGTARFDLATDFGFKVPIREWADRNDPVVDRCGRGRTPFFVNGLAAEPRFSEILYESQTERMLVAPIYMRGQMVGFVDMRDKGGKAPFEQTDIPKSQAIADRIGALFVNKNVFGQRFISLSTTDGGIELTRPAVDRSQGGSDISSMPAVPRMVSQPAPAAAPPVAPVPPPAAARPVRPAEAPPKPSAHVPRIATIVLESRTRASALIEPGSEDVLGEEGLAAIRESLKATLGIPGAVVAMFSAPGVMGGIQEIAARAALTGEAANFLQARLTIWLSKRGAVAGVMKVTQQPPLEPAAAPIDVPQLQKVFTAPVDIGTLSGMYLTVGFTGVPDRNAHELLAANLRQLQAGVEQSLNVTALQRFRREAAAKLLEPDFQSFPELRHHTDAVVALVDRFAWDLALEADEAEQAHLVAMVHDAAMRLLEYDRLYRKHGVTSDEIAILREHVFVGAALAEPLLGREVARAVLCHHERVDGRGYPHELQGDQIPVAARIVQICDAYVAMTDDRTYQPPESPAAALAVIEGGAGSQFDAELAARFLHMMRSGRGS